MSADHRIEGPVQRDRAGAYVALPFDPEPLWGKRELYRVGGTANGMKWRGLIERWRMAGAADPDVDPRRRPDRRRSCRLLASFESKTAKGRACGATTTTFVALLSASFEETA